MPTVAPPKPEQTWVCCCEYDPPGLRCGPCNRRDHEDCIDKRIMNRLGSRPGHLP